MDENDLSEVRFFGKITAGITHELKNVLAVIKETSGLMGDILELTDGETFQHKEKFGKALSTIRRQIEHGVDLLNHLNKFAHAPDKITAEINLNEVVYELIALSGRFARLKNITLSMINSEETIRFTTCQVSLQMLLFSCLEYCMSRLDQNAKIDVGVEKNRDNDECMVIFNCDQELAGNAEDNCLEKLNKLAVCIKGKIYESLHSLTIILSPRK